MELSNSRVRRIVVIGPESTGKSTLCRQLAAHYETAWCPEYARAYLLEHGTKYSFDHLLKIAQGQLALEDEQALLLAAKQPDARFFIDTDMQVMRVWCEYVFNDCHQWILNKIVERKYDLYLLCSPDLPWTPDELREYPDEKNRLELFHMYREIMIEQKVPWTIISGKQNDRLQKAIAAVDKWCY